MTFTRFSLDRLTAQAWKNGGGITREIACSPAGASADGFDWRASMATIAADGPFSSFDGVDRSIVLLEGDGISLHTADGALLHRLDRPHVPHAFDGGLPVVATLLGGTATVFNAMSRRGICHAAMEIRDAPGSSGTAAGGLLLALRGPWRAGTENLAAGEGLWWQGAPLQWQMAPLAAGASMLVLTVSSA